MIDSLDVGKEILQQVNEQVAAESTRNMPLLILYTTGTILTLTVAYLFYIKRFKRAKLEALNNVSLITSRNDKFSAKTDFLIVSPKKEKVKLTLLDEQEQELQVLFDDMVEHGEQKVVFDPITMNNGIYFLSLNSANANILRRIKIEK